MSAKAIQQGQSARAVARIYGYDESKVRALAKSRGIALAHGRGPAVRYAGLTVQLLAPIEKALKDAARRRDMPAEKLAADIITAIITRSTIGSEPTIDRALEMVEDYENSRSEEADKKSAGVEFSDSAVSDAMRS